MREFPEKTVILTFDEIRILLYSLGFDSCEGIFMPQKEFSPQEILKAMYSLEKRGLLTLEEEEIGEEKGRLSGAASAETAEPSFAMDPDLRRMMLAMGKPGGAFEYRPGEDLPGFSKERYNGPEYYCYVLPDYCLLAERDWTRAESLRLRSMDAGAFAAWRREREEEAADQLRAGGALFESAVPEGRHRDEAMTDEMEAEVSRERNYADREIESSSGALSAIL